MTLLNSGVISSFNNQIKWCADNHLLFSAEFLTAAIRDLEHLPNPLEVIAHWRGNPHSDRLPLRLMSAAHALALSGEALELSKLFPSDHTAGNANAAWAVVREAMVAMPSHFRSRLDAIPQHNEIGRAGALLGGFLEIARQTSLPFRLLELGASAGLHQNWDKYCYSLGGEKWGGIDCPITIDMGWNGSFPALDRHPIVHSRSSCDLYPLSVAADSDIRKLQSYIWPEQRARLLLIRKACDLATELGVHIDEERAGTWLPRQLQYREKRQVTVIFNTFFWFYLEDAEKLAMRDAIIEASSFADLSSPLAWLRYEPPGLPYTAPPLLRLTLWPGGETVSLASGHEQGAHMNWLGPRYNDLKRGGNTPVAAEVFA